MANAHRGGTGFWKSALELVARPRSESLNEMAQLIADDFAADYCAVYVLERRAEELVLEACAGAPGPLGARLRVGRGITGLAAFPGKSLAVAHMREDPRAVLLPGQQAQYCNIIAVPFGDGDELAGVFNLQGVAPKNYSAVEIARLEGEIASAFLALIRAIRTREGMRRRAGELQALNELGQAMNSGLDLDESLELIATLAAEATRA